MRAARLFATAFLLAASLTLQSANAQTNAELLARYCPAAKSVDDQQTRAHALADDSQYALAKKAAGLYYDCAGRLSNQYIHDVAYINYLYLLSVSVPSGDTQHLESMLLLVKSEANEFAVKTQYMSVRAEALHLRDDAANELRTMMPALPIETP
jgi:hypothetical protein